MFLEPPVYLSFITIHDPGPYLEGGRGAVALQDKSHKQICLHIFLVKAKYFITILTKSLCGVAKLLFYHYVRFCFALGAPQQKNPRYGPVTYFFKISTLICFHAILCVYR
jgi:hypothetical protein